MAQKITTYLWFDKQAEEAMNFYVDVFKNAPSAKAGDSDIESITYYPSGYDEGPMADMQGKVLNGTFTLAGQKFYALDGGPIFKFTEAISLFVECEDQKEIDYFWGKMSAAPESEQCGWLKDKYGVSWQIVPSLMAKMMSEGTPEQMQRVTQAFLKMKKFDIKALKAAYSE